METVAVITPNWAEDEARLPTDTLRPPPNFPIEWGYLAAQLGADKLELLDAYSEGLSLADTSSRLAASEASVIVISSTPSHLFWRCPPLNLTLVSRYVELARRFKPAARVVVVGPHGTIDPDWTLSKTDADYVFRGEPDRWLAELLKRGPDALAKSPYVATRDEPRTAVAPQSEFSEVGCVDYRLMTPARYTPHAWGQKVSEFLSARAGGRAALLETSRGCAFECHYCLRSGFRRRFRKKPMELIEQELAQLHDLGVRYVFIIDETFGHSRHHASGVMRMLADHGIEYGIQTRPDLLDENRIAEYSRTGCVYVELGLEALEPPLLQRLGKFRDPQGVLRSVRRLQNEIPFVNTNIIDLTNEDFLSDRPVALLRQRDSYGNAPPAFIPYPSTPFGDEAIRHYQRGGESPWDVAEDLFILYSVMSRYGALRLFVRRSRPLRRMLRLAIRSIKTWRLVGGWHHKTRFERLYGRHEKQIATRTSHVAS